MKWVAYSRGAVGGVARFVWISVFWAILATGWIAIPASLSWWLASPANTKWLPPLLYSLVNRVGDPEKGILAGALFTIGLVMLQIEVANWPHLVGRTSAILTDSAARVFPMRAQYRREAVAIRRCSFTSWRRYLEYYGVHTVRQWWSDLRGGGAAARSPIDLPRPVQHSKFLQYVRYADAVITGHIDFLGRSCARRVVNSLKLLLSETPSPAIPQKVAAAALTPEQKKELVEGIQGVARALVGEIAYAFRKEEINRIVYFDTTANEVLAHSLGKRFEAARAAAGSASASVPKLKVVRAPEGHLVFDPQGRGAWDKWIPDNDRILIVEADLADADVIERIVWLVKKQRADDVRVHVAILFDGARRRFRPQRFRLRGRVFRVATTDLGLRKSEDCPDCRAERDFKPVSQSVLGENYVSW